MTAFTNFEDDDIVQGNVAKNVTSTLFSGGASTLTNFFTSSVQKAASTGNYYIDVYDKLTTDVTAEVQFQVAYGHYAGSGSAPETGQSAGLHPSRAVYSQFRNLLIENPTPSTKFTMTDGNTCDRMVFITLNRARFKEQIDVGNWEIILSSSVASYDDNHVHIIDDSSISSGTSENGHKVYNIVSGSGTSIHTNEHTNNYEYWGKIYPELGVIALNGDRIAGNTYTSNGTNTHRYRQNLYLLNGTDSTNASDDIPHLVYCALESGSYFSGRADEDVSSTHYFVRAKNSKYNYTSNDTFTTGSAGQMLHTSMIGDPQVFITTVGLYNETNELVAVAKLSKPLLKNFEREATIRVKLDY